jgi:hypothetical protein
MKGRILVVALSLIGLVLIALVLRATRQTDTGNADAGDAEAEASIVDGSIIDAEPDATDAGVDVADVQVADAADAQPTACAALGNENDGKLAAVDAGKDCVKTPEIDCTSASGISWGYRIKSVVAKDENAGKKGSADWDQNKCSSKVDLELVRFDADGGALALNPVSLEYTFATDENRISLIALSDYDGDGEPELLRTTDVRMHEDSPRHTSQVLSFKKGALSPYSKAPSQTITSAQDIDDDGRTDLVTRGPYAGVTMKNVHGADLPIAPPIFVLHSIKDGSFSSTDDAAMAFTKLACPSKPTIDLTDAQDGNKLDDVAKLVVCARVWGATEQEIVVAWKKACGGDAGNDPIPCQPWPKRLAAITPPFTLH